ncbi:hypothetical protein EN864_33475, partial [bacterium M00.F.Ca.ET.221.01.1.1]
WRIVTITRMRAPAIANAAIPGSGYLLAILVIIGGLFFNIGNIGGAGRPSVRRGPSAGVRPGPATGSAS